MAAKEMWRKWFRKDNLLVLILSGVLLFIIAIPTKEKNTESAQKDSISETGLQDAGTLRQDGTDDLYAQENFAGNLERQLEELLSEMADVGKSRVMITLKASQELVVEKDEPLKRSNTNEKDSAGGSRSISEIDSEETTVYRTAGNDSEPYVIKTLSPRVEGVVVVAQGAGNGTVNKNITEMVQALFGIEAHKVKVVKMTSSK